MKPKEGTILTVAKGMADKAVELVTETEDIIEFCQKVIEHGDYVLSQTPEMLPVLKQAGVVDSGGQGLMQVVKSALDCLMGKELDLSVEGVKSAAGVSGGAAVTDDFDIRFGYCTEFIVNLEKPYDEKSEHEGRASGKADQGLREAGCCTERGKREGRGAEKALRIHLRISGRGA